MNRIELFLSTTGWMARYEGPHSEELVNLFSTRTLPTAFTVQADANTMLSDVQDKNPGVEVYLRP